jgi:hypothetical protein
VGLCVSALIHTLVDTLMVKEYRVGFTNVSE